MPRKRNSQNEQRILHPYTLAGGWNIVRTFLGRRICLNPRDTHYESKCRIKRKRQHRHWDKKHKSCIYIGVPVFVSIIGYLSFTGLRHRATSLNRELEVSLEQKDWVKSHSLVRGIDSGINRLFCPRLKITLLHAQQWFQDQENIYTHVKAQIEQIEKV